MELHLVLEFRFLHLVLGLQVLKVRHCLESVIGLGHLRRPDGLILSHLHLRHCQGWSGLYRLVLLV